MSFNYVDYFGRDVKVGDIVIYTTDKELYRIGKVKKLTGTKQPVIRIQFGDYYRGQFYTETLGNVTNFNKLLLLNSALPAPLAQALAGI